MSLDADHIVDRRRMRRKLSFWRVLAVVLVVATIVAVTWRYTQGDVTALSDSSTYVARVTVQGLIRNDQERTKALDRLAKSNARAVIVHVDSPGGTAAGAEQLYDSLRAVRRQEADGGRGRRARGLRRLHRGARRRPHRRTQRRRWSARSACCSSIRTSPTCMNTVGVKVEEVKSSPLKAAPNGFEPTSPEARAALESIVMDSYAWFRNLVRDRRQLDEANARARRRWPRLHRPPGHRAQARRRRSGTRRTALAWLAKEKNIDPNSPVRDWRLRPRFGDLAFPASRGRDRCSMRSG